MSKKVLNFHLNGSTICLPFLFNEEEQKAYLEFCQNVVDEVNSSFSWEDKARELTYSLDLMGNVLHVSLTGDDELFFQVQVVCDDSLRLGFVKSGRR
ncbi:hypothetical protein MarSH_055 [Marseillevirus Shanghai 1]|nr:hypothetical protein MarSH_055 [Marseillevirus Shanghai 1]